MKKLLIAALMLSGSSAFAAAYGDAGCGLGSMVLGSEKGWTQVFAMTTNGTGMQTFGISSGTSNCTDGGAVAVEKQVPHYVETNRFALAKEAARGGGETVAGLANLMGCKAETFGHNLQKNYDRVFVQTNMEASKIEETIRTSGACGA